MLMTLYLSPCLHPLIIILLLKDVRRNLGCDLPCAPGLLKMLRSGNKCRFVSSLLRHSRNKGTQRARDRDSETRPIVQLKRVGFGHKLSIKACDDLDENSTMTRSCSTFITVQSMT